MIKQIYEKFKQENLNPYFIGQHEGECNKPFVIIKEGNQIPSINSSRIGQKAIDIIIFVPLESYVGLEPYKKVIVNTLKELKYLRKTGTETPAIVDDNKKAYTASIEYVLMKKLEG